MPRYLVPVLREVFYVHRYDPTLPEGERHWIDQFRDEVFASKEEAEAFVAAHKR